jgi:hypothetical protein
MLNIQDQARRAFASGEYDKSLKLFQDLSDYNLVQQNGKTADWVFIRGRENKIIFDPEQTEVAKIGVVFDKNLKVEMKASGAMWQAKIFFPATFLNGYNVAKVYINDQRGGKKMIFMPYLVQDEIALSPTGYVDNEKDLAL